MRFKVGELFCLMIHESSSFPACYRKDNEFCRLSHEAERWFFAEQFCKLPAKTIAFGVVCEYDKEDGCYLFSLITVAAEPWIIRINEMSPALYRIIDDKTLEDWQGTRALLFV